MAIPVVFTKTLASAVSNNISLSQSVTGGVAATITGAAATNSIATIDTATTTNSAIGRRVVVAYSGSDTSFALTGTNATGNPITDTIVGSSGAGYSNLDFVTVSKIVPVGSITAFTAGTNGIGSSPWWLVNWHATSVINVGFGVELVTGAANYTVQYTYDDPNNTGGSLQAPLFPLAFNHQVIVGQAATADGVITNPVAAMRLLINSGTGELRMRILQASIG